MLEGMGAPIDVTFRHSTACSDPFLLAIAFDEGQLPGERELRHLSLRFYARRGERPLLGEIRLHWRATLTVSGGGLLLFAPRSARNRCLPRLSLYAHHLLHLLRQWKSGPASGMTMSFLERRGAMVSFIRPHPTVLVSAVDELGSNIFPMNIMGHSAPHDSGLHYATTDLQAGWSNALAASSSATCPCGTRRRPTRSRETIPKRPPSGTICRFLPSPRRCSISPSLSLPCGCVSWSWKKFTRSGATASL
jgi:hypothetical protein